MGEDLLGIIAEARDIAQADRDRDLIDCPICGNALRYGEREKRCDVGHFATPVGTRAGDV